MTIRTTEEITCGEDFLHSRDVLERIAFLESTTDADTDEELASLKALIEAIREAGTGETPEDYVPIIRDSYFQAFAEEEAESIGAILSEPFRWPYNHIDWEAAAEELQRDYTSIDWEGVTYWVRW